MNRKGGFLPNGSIVVAWADSSEQCVWWYYYCPVLAFIALSFHGAPPFFLFL